MAAHDHDADLILVDVGPNLGAINRSALIGSDHVVIPLAADLFSLQGLRNLGPTLAAWRSDWKKRTRNWEKPDFALPAGTMQPEGYILMQHMERLSRAVKAYKKWADCIPGTYRESVLGQTANVGVKANDNNCLAQLRHYRSLMPMAQEVRKPIFHLSSADGAIGSHSQAVRDAWSDFKDLAVKIERRVLPEG
jgi:cellulose biosynthesis protein BcsQ